MRKKVSFGSKILCSVETKVTLSRSEMYNGRC
jgi:hypothetical protein